jgi:hypothetical protein
MRSLIALLAARSAAVAMAAPAAGFAARCR